MICSSLFSLCFLHRNLVNSDFASSTESRDVCVDAWKSNPCPLKTKIDDVEAVASKSKIQTTRVMSTVTVTTTTSTSTYGPKAKRNDSDSSKSTGTGAFATMFHRHLLLTVKDPVLYLGRCAVILVTNCIFAFVYWNARGASQQQVAYQVWLFMWFMVSTQIQMQNMYIIRLLAHLCLLPDHTSYAGSGSCELST